jgi:hypothetical protein
VWAFISANLPIAILENEHFALCLKMQLVSIKPFAIQFCQEFTN